MKILSQPEGEYEKNTDDISDGDGEDDEIENEIVRHVVPKKVKEQINEEIEEENEMVVEQEEEEEEEGTTIFMSDSALMDSISELLNLLIDKETLSEFGWPEASVEDVVFFFINSF